MTFKPMPVLTLLLLPGLVVLLWLGTWQWGRYQYKTSLPETVAGAEITKLSGELKLDEVFWLYTTFDGQSLWRSYRLLEGCTQAPDAEPVCDRPVFVDTALLASIEPDLEIALAVPDLASETYVLIDQFPGGFLRPTDNPDQRKWYTPNAIRMAEAAGLNNTGAAVLAEPQMIDVVTPISNSEPRLQTIDNPYANPAKIDDLPPARHLGYALTWYGLALAMIGVYLAFHIARGRLRFR